jgi:hypothetical protein
MSEGAFADLVAKQAGAVATPDPDDVCFLCTEAMVKDTGLDGGSGERGSVQSSDDLIRLDRCGHWHHADCAKRWLLGNRATCPRCDVATEGAWPDPPPPPRLPADGVKRALDMLRESRNDAERCALALRILADSALTHRRRAVRIVELNAFARVLDACERHSNDAHVL